MDAQKYMKKMRKRESELIWKDEPLTDAEKLEMMLCSIKPYSRWWRYGYVKSLKRAITLLKEDDKKKAEQKHGQENLGKLRNSFFSPEHHSDDELYRCEFPDGGGF